MNAPSRSTQDPFLRTSIVATVISLVCISILAIGFLFEKSSSEGILLLLVLVPFTCHIVALYLLLNQPDTSSITASIWVGALGIVFTVPLAVIGVLAVGFGYSYVPIVLAFIYFCCQYMSISMGIDWKKSRHMV